MIEIVNAESTAQLQQVGQLFTEYAESLNLNLCFQDFAKELATLPGSYAAPDGRLLLAMRQDEIIGCAGLHKIGDDACEMKRLYVRPQFQGTGAGKLLARNVIEEAAAIGYARLRLDTLPVMEKAIALYRSLGFKEIAPYYANPVAGALFMELDLTRRKS
ncbi:MAG: GNAT family N-acetyltransferase [Pyrinomonadaceae bacterium]